MNPSYLDQLAEAIRRFVPPHLFCRLRVPGRVDWTPQRLAWVALLIAWDEGQTLGCRFEHACQVARRLHAHWVLGRSYSGFARALAAATPRLTAVLKRRFQARMMAMAGPSWKRRRWLAFAVDGTRVEAPHTAANEAALGCAGKEKTAPQVFLTTLWHLGLGLPWDYRLGPGTDSERMHMKDMASDLPPGALVVADAGFVSYALCRRLSRRGRHFLLRVGGNVTLLEGLGYHHEERDGLVYLWPRKHLRSRPLVLRLIVLRAGEQDVYLLTDVLDPVELTDEEAATLFGMRWGEEVFHRSYKQTLQRRKLLGRTGPTCLAEAEWTLLGLWLLGLMTASRLIEDRVDPLRASVAKARDAVRRAMRDRRARRGPRTLKAALRAATKDDYERRGTKEARNYPRKKRERPPGPPRIKSATATEVLKARRHPPPEIPLQWTA